MIQIAGSQLSQWDVGRSVCISDSNATHVHFANQGDSKAPIIKIENGEAIIPDYLLQTGKALNAYAVLDGVTLESRSFAVSKRERPENYVYEDDRRNYIYELITDAEAAVANANQAAQKANEAAEKLGSVVIPTKVSQLQNDSGYLTQAPVTSVNGQTGDVILPPPVLVTVSKREDGTYEADRTYSELKAAREAGSTLLCRYYDDDVYLPFASWHGVFTFCAVVDNVSYQISISTREQVFFQKTELITDLTGYATEGYVDEAIEGIPEAITPPDAAAVGQTIVVREVDENGKPILWEATDLPPGNEWVELGTITLEEDVEVWDVDVNQLNPKYMFCDELLVKYTFLASEANSAEAGAQLRFRTINNQQQRFNDGKGVGIAFAIRVKGQLDTWVRFVDYRNARGVGVYYSGGYSHQVSEANRKLCGINLYGKYMAKGSTATYWGRNLK